MSHISAGPAATLVHALKGPVASSPAAPWALLLGISVDVASASHRGMLRTGFSAQLRMFAESVAEQAQLQEKQGLRSEVVVPIADYNASLGTRRPNTDPHKGQVSTHTRAPWQALLACSWSTTVVMACNQ